MLQRITPSMRCVLLCALSSSAVTFPLLSPKSRVELQHIIATRATRRLFGRIADMRDGRLPSNHRGDRIACCETPRITGSRLRRPRRAASWAPLGLRRYLRRARLRAPRGGGRLCAAFRHAGAETTWSGSATAHNRKQHIEREVSSAWAEGATRRFAADTSRLGSCCAWSPSRFGSVGLSAGWLWAVTGSPRMSTISGLASELLGVSLWCRRSKRVFT